MGRVLDDATCFRTGRSVRACRRTRTPQFQIDLVRCLWAVLPAAILWGASFPLALAAVGRGEKDPARLVGTVYAANTIGGIIGALFGSLLIIAWLGTQDGAAHSHRRRGDQRAHRARSARRARARRRPTIKPRGSCWASRPRRSLSLLHDQSVPPVPPLLVGYGRWFANRLANENDFIYMGEGMMSSVAVSQLRERRAQLPQRRQGAGVERAAGHAAAAHARPPDDAAAAAAELGARDRLRRRRHGGRGQHRPGAQERDDRRDRAARAEGGVEVLRRAQLQRRHESQGARADRRRAPLHSHDASRSSTRSRPIRSIRG